MNVKLSNVRLSFPALFVPKAFEAGKEPNFSAAFLLDKIVHADLVKQLEGAQRKVAADQWKGTIPKGVKFCLRDGSEKDAIDGYDENIKFLTASCRKRPPVVNRDLTPLAEQDGVLYAGCYVNATIRLWAQDNQYGKRVNAQLRAVQFVRDGDAFGEKPVDAAQEFDALSDDDANMLG